MVNSCKNNFFRAQRRIQGEDVFGNKIRVLNAPGTSQQGTSRTYTGRKLKSASSSVESNNQCIPSVNYNQFLSSTLLDNPWTSIPVSKSVQFLFHIVLVMNKHKPSLKTEELSCICSFFVSVNSEAFF